MRRLPISNGFTSGPGRAEGSSPCGLAPGWPWSARPLRSSPITGPSSLLRAVPPLCPASVLCRLRCPPLAALPLAAKTTSPGRRYRGDRFSCSMPAPAASSRHLYTGHRQSSTQAAPWLRARPRRRVPLFPGVRRSPGCDAIVPPIDASAVVHTRSSSRRPPDPLTAGLFPQRSPPRLLTGAACGSLGSPPALASRRAKPPSLAQHGSCRRPSTSPPLPFQDTPPNGGCARWRRPGATYRVSPGSWPDSARIADSARFWSLHSSTGSQAQISCLRADRSVRQRATGARRPSGLQ